MLDVVRIKNTGQIVYPIGSADANHTLCLFPFKTRSHKGNWGVVQPVKNDNLKKDRETLF